jgi:hypothetical protein
MKATIEVPDDLYRRVKAKSALQGRTVRAVTVELFQRWLDQDGPATTISPVQALEDWFRLADDAMKDAPPGPTGREILEQDRNRLERR